MNVSSAACASWRCLSLAGFWITRFCMDGRSRSRRVRGGVFNINLAGVCPVVLCGVTRYRLKKLHRRSSRLPVVFFNSAFIVCTARSANPLLEGWYGEHLTCFMPFALQNCSNSSLVKQLPLYETMVIGSPSTANVCRRFVIVALVVADGNAFESSNAVFCFSSYFHLALCRVSSCRGAKMVLRLHRKVW